VTFLIADGAGDLGPVARNWLEGGIGTLLTFLKIGCQYGRQSD
jgi:hypothetical protein